MGPEDGLCLDKQLSTAEHFSWWCNRFSPSSLKKCEVWCPLINIMGKTPGPLTAKSSQTPVLWSEQVCCSASGCAGQARAARQGPPNSPNHMLYFTLQLFFFPVSSSWINISHPLSFFSICSSFIDFTSLLFNFGLRHQHLDEPVAPISLFFGIFCLDSGPDTPLPQLL